MQMKTKTSQPQFVDIEMVFVRGGAFTMGATSEQGGDCDGDEKPAHQVTLSDFHIGKYEVTQAQWNVIMDSNPSHFKGDDLPVENVSWDEVQEFIRRLNTKTGKNYRLPTEAEWEYAARGGANSNNYKYSGSNNIGDVAWYKDNSESMTHPVGTKQANELGLYDMSGNVREWCQDWWENYSSDSQTNPSSPASGSFRVNRGGSWISDAGDTRVSGRSGDAPGFRSIILGFRLASGSMEEVQPPQTQSPTPDPQPVDIDMVFVRGGTFTMGATSEQGDDFLDREKPAHLVTLSDFSIGKYEVTQAQWMAVMGTNPSRFRGDNLPVERVSWNDVQEFIRRLNEQTGKNYRLPTEAEWEYAARGGASSNNYKYSGSNNIGDVAWYFDNSGRKTHPVGSKRANELGLYDMSGNVWEWCQDWYGNYSSDSQTNPSGPASSGSSRVFRGGGWNFRGTCVSIRSKGSPDSRYGFLGFRLASD
jgi:formylglycine-generating enzyme required for sulfatase activity